MLLRKDIILFVLSEKGIEDRWHETNKNEPDRLQAIYNRFNIRGKESTTQEKHPDPLTTV